MNKATLCAALLASSLCADNFSATNVQFLYGEHFGGNSFVYSTTNAKKSTATVEHYRTFDYGDVFGFVDFTKGDRLDGSSGDIYGEISPRLSISKTAKQNLSVGYIKDFTISSQYNSGKNYDAWLIGGGVDLDVLGFRVFSVNVYDKRQNIARKHLTQYSCNYLSKDFYGFHIDGWHDATDDDYQTQNQLLYDIGRHFTKEKLYLGFEYLYYKQHKGAKESANAMQIMFKWVW